MPATTGYLLELKQFKRALQVNTVIKKIYLMYFSRINHQRRKIFKDPFRKASFVDMRFHCPVRYRNFISELCSKFCSISLKLKSLKGITSVLIVIPCATCYTQSLSQFVIIILKFVRLCN